MSVQPLAGLGLPVTSANRTQNTDDLRALSQKLETTFVAEMLKHSGFGKVSESFGGGIGEEQFTSFLLHEHAERITQAGGFGLSEQIFRALTERSDT